MADAEAALAQLGVKVDAAIVAKGERQLRESAEADKQRAQEIVSRARLGGLPVVDAPFFPEGTVLVTFLKNLSIYWQTGARRRHIEDEPKRNRIVNYESTNDAYVVEDYDCAALVENIVIGPNPAPGA